MKRPTKKQREAMRKAAQFFGQQGGYARAEKMTPEQRRAAAQKAANARWANHRKEKPQ